MTCPQCKVELSPWPWEDGGYKGFRCPNCDEKWWSARVAMLMETAARQAVIETLAKLDQLPEDATTDEEFKRMAMKDENL